jgi:hypothetical protein
LWCWEEWEEGWKGKGVSWAGWMDRRKKGMREKEGAVRGRGWMEEDREKLMRRATFGGLGR